jgi:hypothetical protein
MENMVSKGLGIYHPNVLLQEGVLRKLYTLLGLAHPQTHTMLNIVEDIIVGCGVMRNEVADLLSH